MGQLTISPGEVINQKIINLPVGPGIMDGLKVYVGQIDMDDSKTATFTLKCKSHIGSFVSCDTGTALIATSLSGTTLTVTITCATSGFVNYQIWVTETENVAHLLAGTADVTIAESGLTA